jgi:hypothetical protein
LEIKLEKLSERILKESEMNQSIIREAEGQEVLYGSEVCLMHYDSRSFIKANNDCAQTNKIGYDCQLSNWYAISMIFKILPRYKSRQDGEIIQYNDNLIFQNIKYNTYLSFTSDIKLPHDREYEKEEANPFRVEQNVLDRYFNRNKVYLSQEPETAWRIVLFRKVGLPVSSVMGNDLIQLKHTEREGYLSAGLRYESNQCEAYIRNYEGEFKIEEDSVSNIWEIEHVCLDERGREFKMEENSTEDDMNYVKISTQFRLRHFLTGKLLQRSQINAVTDEVILAPIQQETQTVQSKLTQYSSSISCMPILKNITTIKINSSYYLLLDATLLDHANAKYLKADPDKLLGRESLMGRLKDMDAETAQFFSPLSDKDIGEERHKVIANFEFSTQDAFIIERIDADRHKDVLFVRSCLPFMKQLAHIMKGGNAKLLKSEVYFKMEEILCEICAFLFDLSRNADFQISNMSGDPLQKRQQILKDMKIIDILIDTLYFPFKSKMFDLNNIQSSEPITILLTNVYSTLRYTIQEYRPNELQASQWLSLIMEQSLKTREYNDIQSGRTLTELIDNNKRILESRIKADTISQFIRNLVDNERDSKSINILRAICICDGKPMIKNQKEISEQLLRTPSHAKELIFPLRRFGNKIEVQVLDINHKWFEINDFNQNTGTTEVGKAFKYFISSINLFADLCMDRNYLAVEVLQKVYPMDYCFDICIDTQNPFELRSAFCRLVEHLWVRVHPYVVLNLPEYTKVMSDEELLSDEVDKYIVSSSEDTTKFDLFKKFCIKYLDSAFEGPNITCEENNEQNGLSLSTLYLTEYLNLT